MAYPASTTIDWYLYFEVPDAVGRSLEIWQFRAARARRTQNGIIASVAPEVPPPGSFLRETKGAENRIEIELTNCQVIRLSGQGAGRWPTAVSVVGDLHEIARLVEVAC